MVVCKKCKEQVGPCTEAEFDYWNWFDNTEDFEGKSDKCCELCGKEFDDGDLVYITENNS